MEWNAPLMPAMTKSGTLAIHSLLRQARARKPMGRKE
jgi:hypothetical protein